MDPSASTPSPSEFAFTLSVSCEPAFTEAVRALAIRAGTMAGCSDEHSARLGACVGGVFDALIAGGATHATDIDVDVHGSSRVVTVDVQCPEACRSAVKDAIGAPSLRALVDRLEFERGDSNGHAYCRVTQQVHA